MTMPDAAPPRTPRLVLIARLVCALTVLLVASRQVVPGQGVVVAGSIAVALAVAVFLAAAAWLARRVRGASGAVFACVAFAALFGLYAQAQNVASYVLTGRLPHFPTPGLWALVLGANPMLALGYAVALGWQRRALTWAVIMDALLLVGAAAIIGIGVSYLTPWPYEVVPPGARALLLLWRTFTVAELVLVALLVALRSDLLGMRAAIGLTLGTTTFAIANGLHGRLVLLRMGASTTGSDLLWALTLLCFSFGLEQQQRGAEGAGDDALERTDEHRVARDFTAVRASAVVVAILIAAAAALALGFRERRSPELAVALAVLCVLFAARAFHAIRLQHRHAALLAERVVAERELSSTLEHHVAVRTAELAEAKRVLQRMWQLGQQITLELNPARVLQRFIEAVVDVAQADGGALGLTTEDGRLRVVAATGVGASWLGATLPLDDSAMGRALRQGRAWTHEDVSRSPDAAPPDLALPPETPRIHGLAVVPIHRRGERIGAVSVASLRTRRFSPEELSRVEALADILTVALSNAELVETLRKAEWRFRTLFRAAPDAVLTVLQSTGRIREANDAVRELTGVDPARLVGRPLDELVVPEDRARLAAALASAFDGPPARLEVRLLREGGPARLASLAASRVAEAEPPALLLVGRDISGEREMRARLLETERLAAVGELVAGVAHEVNNPLSSISAFAQLLLRDSTLTAAQRDSLDVIKSETMRASQVVKDLLAFARRSEPRREAVDLNQLVERTVRLRGYQLDTSRVRVETALAADLPLVMGDARQLQQVVLNLVTNAIQAMAASGGGALRLATVVDGDEVRLEVADTGPGIPDEIRARIFEPFFTTKKEGEGTGLGLSVSYGIVAAHGGRIDVAHSSPQGTTFAVTLVAAGASAAAPAGVGEAPAPAPRSPLAGRRVLVADDEPALREAIAAFGRLRGFAVTGAEDGRAALDAIRAGGVDALVCDLRMPGMDGVALHEALLREHPALAACTVFVTGDVVASGGRLGGASARQPLLIKPFPLERLEEALASVLRAVVVPAVPAVPAAPAAGGAASVPSLGAALGGATARAL